MTCSDLLTYGELDGGSFSACAPCTWRRRIISDLIKAGITADTAGVSSQLIVMAQEYNGKSDAVEAVSKALPPVAVIVALGCVCWPFRPPF